MQHEPNPYTPVVNEGGNNYKDIEIQALEQKVLSLTAKLEMKGALAA